MASGVPVIIAEHFRSTFGDAALYTDPAGVRDLVLALHADRPRYQAVVRRAREFVERRFGSASHISRLGLRPSRPIPAPRVVVRPEPGTRVLLVGDELDRLLAIARRLPERIEPVVVTGSAVLPSGLLVEHLPDDAALGNRWTAFLRNRLRHLVDLHAPAPWWSTARRTTGFSRRPPITRTSPGCGSAGRCGGATPAGNGRAAPRPSTRFSSRASSPRPATRAGPSPTVRR